MKIICCDNFNRESVSDTLIAYGLSQHTGELVVRLLNEYSGAGSSSYYKLVPDEQQLYEFIP